MKKLALVSILCLLASSANAGLLDDIKGAAGKGLSNEAPQSAAPESKPAASGDSGQGYGVSNTPPPGFQKSCDVVRGETFKKLKPHFYQPDKMMAGFFIPKTKALEIFKEDGYTCANSKHGFDKAKYDARIACSKPYSGNQKPYKWIDTALMCKGEKCNEPTIGCAEKKFE